MSAPVSGRVALGVFARAFLIQASWNYRTMIGNGFAFALLPALRRLHRGDPEAVDAALRRHVELFNAHPYLAPLALGAVARMEEEGADPDEIRRFKTAVRGPLGGLGDRLMWAGWLPLLSLAAVCALWLGAPAVAVVLGFLALYNVLHLALRIWSFRTGLRFGRDVARPLASARLSEWSDRIRAVSAFALGLAAGALLAAPGGVSASGVPWAVAAAGAFTAGLRFGHRAWRPAAAVVTLAVVAFAGWGRWG